MQRTDAHVRRKLLWLRREKGHHVVHLTNLCVYVNVICSWSVRADLNTQTGSHHMKLVDEFLVQWTHVLWDKFLVYSQAILQNMCLGQDMCLNLL